MAPNAFDVRLQERRRDLSCHLSSGIAKHHLGNVQKQICLRRICSSIGVGRVHATHTGGVPCLSSLFLEIGDFSSKDESGDALLDSWTHPVFRRNVPQDAAKIVQMSDMTKKN